MIVQFFVQNVWRHAAENEAFYGVNLFRLVFKVHSNILLTISSKLNYINHIDAVEKRNKKHHQQITTAMKRQEKDLWA